MPEALTLEELARGREELREKIAAAEAEVKRTERPYLAAVGEEQRLRDALKMVEKSIEAGGRSYVIRRAVEEAGIESTADPIVLVRGMGGPPDIFELVAIGPEGTPLYLHRPDRPGRRGGKAYARPAREGDAERCAAYAAAVERRKDLPSMPSGIDAFEERKRVKAIREEFDRELREEFGPNPHDTLPREVWGSEGRLVRWEDRGSGAFGAGTGSLRPQAPPEGGKWRWLKVREQEELTA